VGAPLCPSRAEVDLEIALDTPDGRRVASYAAAKGYRSWDVLYDRTQLEIGARVNDVLTEAVTDLLGQVVEDQARLVEAARAARLVRPTGP
jgi:hypothetical protein